MVKYIVLLGAGLFIGFSFNFNDEAVCDFEYTPGSLYAYQHSAISLFGTPLSSCARNDTKYRLAVEMGTCQALIDEKGNETKQTRLYFENKAREKFYVSACAPETK